MEKLPEDPAHVYRGAIYFPNGLPWYSGQLRLDPPDPPELDLTDLFLILVWTGERLMLADDRSLWTMPPDARD